jgi:uncharacterized FlgJ-related protein/LysM repeat protein
MLRLALLILVGWVMVNNLYSIDFDHNNSESLLLENAAAETVLIDNENARIYINRFLHIAISEMDRSGIPASIKLAQGILESGSGTSQLAKYAHNHFGIKCGGSWKGKTYFMWDDDVEKSCFRVFEKDEDSYIAHTEFVANPLKSSRYGFLFNLAKYDYKGWANGLQKAGYATSQTYANALISIIERYNLYKYDHLTFKTESVAAGEMDSIFYVAVVAPDIKPIDTTYTDAYVLIPDPFGNISDSVRIILTKSTFEVNALLTVYVQPEDDLAKIAERYKISVSKLKKFNEIDKSTNPRAGQYIFLQKKKKSYEGDEQFHTVLEGQTLYDISQHYGIMKKELVRLNKVYKCNTPSPGTLIRLKK